MYFQPSLPSGNDSHSGKSLISTLIMLDYMNRYLYHLKLHYRGKVTDQQTFYKFDPSVSLRVIKFKQLHGLHVHVLKATFFSREVNS